MAQGLQVWDASGQIRLDTGERLGTLLGSVTTGTVNGSITVPRFSDGTAFFYAVPSSFGPGAVAPAIGVSGTTLQWEFPADGTRVSVVITYGIF